MKNNKNMQKDNEDFFNAMTRDAVQQQIQGEASFLRGLIRLIYKKRTIGVFFIASLVAMVLLSLGCLGLIIIIFGINSAIKQSQYTALLIVVSAPAIISYIVFSLGIKIIWHLWQVFKIKNISYKTEASLIFLFLGFINLLFILLAAIVFSGIYFKW